MKYRMTLWERRLWLRPQRVTYDVIDPFDGRVICSGSMPYNPHRGASGHYSRMIKRVREGMQSIEPNLFGRNLVTRTRLVFPAFCPLP